MTWHEWLAWVFVVNLAYALYVGLRQVMKKGALLTVLIVAFLATVFGLLGVFDSKEGD